MGAFLSILALMGGILSVSGSPPVPHPPTIVFSSKPAVLSVKKLKAKEEGERGGEGGVERLDYRTLLQTRVPSLFTEFKPLWKLFNAHLQTLYCVFGDFTTVDRMSYVRKYIQTPDGGTLGLDFAPLNQASVREDAPIVVVQHGLTGGSYEPYVRAILSRACAPVEKGGLGYRAIVINFRGCEEGAETRLHSVCALACPWNLQHNNHGLLNTFIGKHIYSKGMGGNLLNLLRKHEASLTADPTHYVCIAAKNALTLKNPTLEQFDEAFTRIGGGPPPHFPFPSSDDYYVWGSSDRVIPNITVPFLGINADDDPVVTRVPIDGVTNGLVAIRLTRGGGHLGWFTAGDGFVDRWTNRPVLEWLKLMGEDYIIEQGSNPRRMFVDEEGWLREEGMPHLGSKEMKEKIRVVEGNGGEVGILQGL